MSKIGTRTVSASDNINESLISGLSFIIKDYQRGYRWESQQVEDLLQDLKDFNHHNHKVKYCMQPLVVKKVSKNEENCTRELSQIINTPCSTNDDPDFAWELIDGQQRLTTTLLILNSCNDNFKNPPKLPYRVLYEVTRNIDEYYINNAKDTIDKWFEKFGDASYDIKNEIRSKINSDIQFIWYEVDSDANSVDIFTKLNIGKIPLTNAELFKAQLLNPDNAPIGEKEYLDFQINLTQIAFEWDKIEQSLRDDEFWNFISNENCEGETRIDYLLRLYATQLKTNNSKPGSSLVKIQETDKLFPFLSINTYLRENPQITSKDIWDEIVRIHDKMKAWYGDNHNNKLYHYIGFLIAVSKSSIAVITDLIKETEGKKKSEVEEQIYNKICKAMSNIKLDELSYHKDGYKIRKVLLLFNLLTMVQSKTDNRFSFKQYKDTKTHWDIEHIHARATDEEIRAIITPSKRTEFLNGLSRQFEEINDTETVKEIEKFIAEQVITKVATEDAFLEFCCKITDKYGEFDENGLGNLTLLDSATNKSYHNALYPVKRQKIIERDKGEVFIPVCTKNVFLKMYSSNYSNMMKWTSDDAEDYLNAIKKVLVEEAKICQ